MEVFPSRFNVKLKTSFLASGRHTCGTVYLSFWLATSQWLQSVCTIFFHLETNPPMTTLNHHSFLFQEDLTSSLEQPVFFLSTTDKFHFLVAYPYLLNFYISFYILSFFTLNSAFQFSKSDSSLLVFQYLYLWSYFERYLYFLAWFYTLLFYIIINVSIVGGSSTE